MSTIIGITLDLRDTIDPWGYPWYASRKNHSDRISESGATPLYIPYQHDHIDIYLDTIDGLLIPGSKFDIPPFLYGEDVKYDNVFCIEERSLFECEIVKHALKRNMPVFGICGGYHVINVALGGTLIQDIENDFKTNIQHRDLEDPEKPSHEVFIDKDTLLYDILGLEKMSVNSLHHQAIKDLGENLKATAKAPDGLLEAIESTVHNFCFGVQWHPEFKVSPDNKKFFDRFIKEAEIYKSTK